MTEQDSPESSDSEAETTAQGDEPTGRFSWFTKDRVRTVIFEADTPAGKIFDVWLIILILLSVAAVMADTVDWIHEPYATTLLVLEWVF
ncbi:MAG: hypothetical protein AAF529_11135, partial [Pseudomonadota bacterium]